ncbi:MAG TPA: FAD-dependent oxidoreductase [Chroococcales cyanobacterium]
MTELDKVKVSSRREFLLEVGNLLTTGGILAVSGEMLGQPASGSATASAKDGSSAAPAGATETAGSTSASDSALKYTVAEWTGDDFTNGHKLRDDGLPDLPKNAEKQVDFVIVGGGIAGLTAAHYLKDHDYLLIEQYEQLGGQSRGGSFQGLDYSLGAAYIGSVDGDMGDLLSDLGIEPVKLGSEKNAWRFEDRWFKGIDGSDKIYQCLKQVIEEAKPLWNRLPGGLPAVPLSSADLLKLDSTSFMSCLNQANPAFIKLFDSFCRSANCAGVEGMSALAGMVLAADLVEPSYVFEGGNSRIARALANKLDHEDGNASRHTRGFVWAIEPKQGGASVVYADASGALHRIDCQHVIVAVPLMIAGRILQGLSAEMKSDLLSLQYGSYLVANLLLKKRCFDVAYDNFCSEPFTFADITQADTPYVMAGRYKPQMGSVLTIYQPYDAGPAGRATLLTADRMQCAQSMLSQMSQLASEIGDQVDTVVLTRWGHAMAVTGPGYFATISKLNKSQSEWFTLAHSSTQGPPCAEAAVNAARHAADRAIGMERRKSLIFPRYSRNQALSGGIIL